jgi:hypothetical protein
MGDKRAQRQLAVLAKQEGDHTCEAVRALLDLGDDSALKYWTKLCSDLGGKQRAGQMALWCYASALTREGVILPEEVERVCARLLATGTQKDVSSAADVLSWGARNSTSELANFVQRCLHYQEYWFGIQGCLVGGWLSEAVTALGRVPGDSEEWRNALQTIARLDDQHEFAVCKPEAAFYLAKYGDHGDSLEILITGTGSQTPSKVRIRCADALIRLGHDSYISILREAMEDDSVAVRAKAYSLLMQHGDASFIEKATSDFNTAMWPPSYVGFERLAQATPTAKGTSTSLEGGRLAEEYLWRIVEQPKDENQRLLALASLTAAQKIDKERLHKNCIQALHPDESLIPKRSPNNRCPQAEQDAFEHWRCNVVRLTLLAMHGTPEEASEALARLESWRLLARTQSHLYFDLAAIPLNMKNKVFRGFWGRIIEDRDAPDRLSVEAAQSYLNSYLP